MTYFEAVKKAKEQLLVSGVADAAWDSRLLLEYLLGVDRNWYFMHMRDEMPDNCLRDYGELIGRRSARVPLQHITGTQDFMGLTFHVNEHTLVPRQDTETLVEEALRYVRPNSSILDMCTGSGCILISLLHSCPEACGMGTDISEEALKVARRNAKEIGVQADFVASDLFACIPGKYDIIVSNPPYITAEVIKTLEPEVREHEPYAALYGPEDGLFFYRRITQEAADHLKEGGVLLYEIGYDQGEAVSAILSDAGYLHVRLVRDLAGRDRVVIGELPAPAGEEKEYV